MVALYISYEVRVFSLIYRMFNVYNPAMHSGLISSYKIDVIKCDKFQVVKNNVYLK